MWSVSTSTINEIKSKGKEEIKWEKIKNYTFCIVRNVNCFVCQKKLIFGIHTNQKSKKKKKLNGKNINKKILKSNHTEKISDNKWQKQQKQNEQQEKFRIKYMNI